MVEKHSALLERLRRDNDDFVMWEDKHKRLEREIRSLNRKHVLTPEEEVLRKNLQKEKLISKDKIKEILRMEESKENSK